MLLEELDDLADFLIAVLGADEQDIVGLHDDRDPTRQSSPRVAPGYTR